MSGFQGSQGFQGFQGFQGSQGFQGFQGSQGETGLLGIPGIQGGGIPTVFLTATSPSSTVTQVSPGSQFPLIIQNNLTSVFSQDLSNGDYSVIINQPGTYLVKFLANGSTINSTFWAISLRYNQNIDPSNILPSYFSTELGNQIRGVGCISATFGDRIDVISCMPPGFDIRLVNLPAISATLIISQLETIWIP